MRTELLKYFGRALALCLLAPLSGGRRATPLGSRASSRAAPGR
ncbi:MAG: hypothetical protein ABW250_11100 [Pyrinomonadaceae bacterium]